MTVRMDFIPILPVNVKGFVKGSLGVNRPLSHGLKTSSLMLNLNVGSEGKNDNFDQRVNCSAPYFGYVHKGMYISLFTVALWRQRAISSSLIIIKTLNL